MALTDVPRLGPSLGEGSVRLRPHRADDAERCYEQCVDPLSQAWTSVPADYTREMAADFVERIVPAGWAANTEWAFALDVDGRFGGTVSLRAQVPGRAEIAYGAHPDVRGTGAVDRGLRLLLAYGFDQLLLEAVEWRAFVGNHASRRTAWRLGFTVEGTLRRALPHHTGLRDAWIGSLLREDPREPRQAWAVEPDA